MSAPKPRFPRQCLSHFDGGLYCPDVRIYSGNPTWTDASRPPPIALPLYTHPHSLGLAAPHSLLRKCPSPTHRAAARPFLSESERSRMSSLLWRSRAHTATRSAFVIFFLASIMTAALLTQGHSYFYRDIQIPVRRHSHSHGQSRGAGRTSRTPMADKRQHCKLHILVMIHVLPTHSILCVCIDQGDEEFSS